MTLPQSSQYRVTARQVDISLKKESDEWWPKLISSNLKPTWLKVYDRKYISYCNK